MRRGRIHLRFLTSDTTLTAGSQVDAGVTVDLCAEVELTVGVGHNVIPDTDFDTVAAAVAGVPAFRRS